MQMSSNIKGSGKHHEKALFDWFSTEATENDFVWSICHAREIVRREFYTEVHGWVKKKTAHNGLG